MVDDESKPIVTLANQLFFVDKDDAKDDEKAPASEQPLEQMPDIG